MHCAAVTLRTIAQVSGINFAAFALFLAHLSLASSPTVDYGQGGGGEGRRDSSGGNMPLPGTVQCTVVSHRPKNDNRMPLAPRKDFKNGGEDDINYLFPHAS